MAKIIGSKAQKYKINRKKNKNQSWRIQNHSLHLWATVLTREIQAKKLDLFFPA
jgi:hypothetical protein